MSASNLFWGEGKLHMYKSMIKLGVEVEHSLSVNETYDITTAVSFISVNMTIAAFSRLLRDLDSFWSNQVMGLFTDIYESMHLF